MTSQRSSHYLLLQNYYKDLEGTADSFEWHSVKHSCEDREVSDFTIASASHNMRVKLWQVFSSKPLHNNLITEYSAITGVNEELLVA